MHERHVTAVMTAGVALLLAATTATAATATTAAAAAATSRLRTRGCGFVLARRILPPGARCLGAVRGDVTGGAGAQLVVLSGTASGRGPGCGERPGGFTLELVRNHGATARTRLPCSDGRPTLVRAGDVNAVPGIELVVELDEISSGSTFGVYTFAGGRLQRVGPLLSAGGDSASREGFSCRAGPPPELMQRIMELRHAPIDGPWRWTVITYAWRGATLQRIDRRRFVRRGLPRGRVIADGTDCGRPLGTLR